MLVERTEYLELLKRFKDKDVIKVVTGIRRCGKSTLFALFIDYLEKNGVKKDQIIQINLEDAQYDFNNYSKYSHFFQAFMQLRYNGTMAGA